MREPGGLTDLGAEGRAAWDETVARCLLAAMPSPGSHPFLARAPDERTPHRTGPDWNGLPARIVARHGRARALDSLDDERTLQEEYVEWRVVRSRGGAIARVEFTTELVDYWRVLATHEPERTLELVGSLTRTGARPREVYGVRDPAALAAPERRRAFDETMLESGSPLNDGRRGICFMVHPSNDLLSLVRLAAAATHPITARDPETRARRPATANEAIPSLDGAAVAGRASDPVLVERLIRLAHQRRLTALDDPVGVYIAGVERTRLRTRDGAEVPAGWFALSRGRQRLVLEIPAGRGPLVDTTTERQVDRGGQIAELVQLRTFLRVSDPGVVDG